MCRPLRTKIKCNQTIVPPDTLEFRTKILVKPNIVIRPPERTPSEDDERRPRSTHSFEFTNRFIIVTGLPPLHSVIFEEWQSSADRKALKSVVAVIDKNE